MTQKTVLNDAHRRLGAKMVDFGGWDMPLHYGSQLEEHHAVRRDCGMFDVSHMCAVDVAGADAQAFLLRLLANNVSKLKAPGKALYSAMLNETGGVVDDLIVYFVADGQYRIVINAGTAEKDLAWMAARQADWQLEVAIVARRDLAIIAVQGPNARARVWQVLPATRAPSEALKPFFSVAVGDEIDDEVIDHPAGLVEHRAVKCLAGFLELVDVVGQQAQEKVFGLRSGDIDGAHVRDVEHAAVAAHGVVFFELRTVVQRHVPAAEVDHFGAEAAMRVVEDGFLCHSNPW